MNKSTKEIIKQYVTDHMYSSLDKIYTDLNIRAYMINSNFVSPEYVKQIQKEIGFKHTTIMMKTIHALLLLYDVSQFIPDFVFKGGTSRQATRNMK